MKKTIEIEDELPELEKSVREETLEAAKEWIEKNDGMENWNDDKAHECRDFMEDVLHDICDWSVPVYTSRINDIMYLHGDAIEQAFDAAGLGGKDDPWPMGWEAAAIYCQLMEAAREELDKVCAA